VRKIIENPVKTLAIIAIALLIIVFSITAFWGAVSESLLPNTKLGLYDKAFWENFLVEMHGIVFEISIIGILIIWLDTKRSRNNDIERLKEDLEDYSSLDFPEINVKKLGHIKRLNALGINNIDVQNLVLNGLKVKRIRINGTRLIGLKIMNGSIIESQFKSIKMRSSNFQGTAVKNTIFEYCDLLKSIYIESKCKGIRFSHSCLERADFTNADLQNCIFNDCNVRETNFEGSNLKHAVFRESTNLTADMLAKAKNLDYVKVSDAIMTELVRLRPDMKYQGNKGRP
jgi:uncharacterized protein YjbI with pentapeptide repeats